MTSAFQRLVRFEDKAGNILYGDIGDATPHPDSISGRSVIIYEGDSPFDPLFRRTSRQEQIHKLLSPLPFVPLIVGVGLNYKKHIQEVNFEIPKFPAIFIKPPTTITSPGADILVHPEAKLLDFEGELCFIVGRDCKDLGDKDNPLEYVLGYTAGNDISSRYWQASTVSSGQASYAKGFDQFAPIGPAILSSHEMDPSQFMLTTLVNGEERQRSSTDDLLFDVGTIIRFLSVGRTLPKGTVVMTGTPSGVIAGEKDPVWLKHGDVVEVGIDKIGWIKNKIVFTATQEDQSQ